MDRPPLEVADLVRAAGDAFIERSRKWISWKQANGSVRANKFHPTCRGIGGGMYARGTMRNTGSPSGDRDMDQLATRERQTGPCGMAEGLAVPTKPGNSGGGKEPQLKTNVRSDKE